MPEKLKKVIPAVGYNPETFRMTRLKRDRMIDERKKKIVLILLMAAGSAYFLFAGFSMLFHEEGSDAPFIEQGVDRNSSVPPR